MTPADRAIENAMIEAAARVFTRRATALRTRAKSHTADVEHDGRLVTIAEPEATIMLTTAGLFDACAADVRDLAGSPAR